MIQLKNISMEFGDKILFRNVTLSFSDNNKYGIVGANGSGKSTLLKLISGELSPTGGQVNIPSTKSLSFLKQNQFEFEQEKILDVVLMGQEKLWRLSRDKLKLEKKQHLSVEEGHRLAEMELQIEKLGGYTAEARASVILKGLGFPTEQHQHTMSTLSGGYKLRVLLAQCLYSSPDILLLDEPNNHLDINSINWLANYLRDYDGVVVLVSHDHHFINRVSDFIVDIDYETLKVYKGNYELFVRAKELEVERKEKEIEKQEKRKEELQKFVDRFRAKATKARQANSRKKQIEKMEDIRIAKSSRRHPFFKFLESRPSGNPVLEANQISKSFGDKKVLHNIDLKANRGDKIAIIGPNGIGKTTLLKIIMNDLNHDSGDYCWGNNVNFGYFAQNHKEQLPGDETVYGWLQGNFPGENVGTIRKSLGRMLFTDEDMEKQTGNLSGGETARLIFAKLTMMKTNVLILDEPTNHLDLESIESLAEAMNQFSGTIIFVSHDRYFIDQVADTILEIIPKGYNRFPGNYSEFIAKFGEDYLDRTGDVRVKTSDAKKTVTTSEKKNLVQERRLLQKELTKLKNRESKYEDNVFEIESELEEIENILAGTDIYQNNNLKKLQETLKHKEVVEHNLESAMGKWEEDQNSIVEIEKKINHINKKISDVQNG